MTGNRKKDFIFELKFLLTIFLFICFMPSVNGFFVTFEGNDNESFLNEFNNLNIEYNVASSSFLKFPVLNSSLWTYYKNPNNNSVTYLQWTWYATNYSSLYSPSVKSSYIDWTDWSLAFLVSAGTYPSYNYYWALGPTYAKSRSPSYQWNSPTSLNDYLWLRFFKGSTWWSSLTSWTFLTYWFQRAEVIVWLKNDSIEYHNWNWAYSWYSTKTVFLSTPFNSFSFTKYYRWLWTSQPFLVCGPDWCNVLGWSYFWTYLPFDQSQPLKSPAFISWVMMISLNTPWTSYSTASSQSLLLKNSNTETWKVYFTFLDCAIPNANSIFDSSFCPVIRYWYISRNSDWSDYNMFDWSASFFNDSFNYNLSYIISQNSIVYWDWAYTNYLYSTWSEQIISWMVFTTSYSSIPSVSSWGGVFVPWWWLAWGGWAWDWTGAVFKLESATGENPTLYFFACPYENKWSFLTMQISNIPWLGAASGSRYDFNLLAPVTCFYSTFLEGKNAWIWSWFFTWQSINNNSYLWFTVTQAKKDSFATFANFLIDIPIAIYILTLVL